MPHPLPVDYLQDDEEILHQTGRHALSVVDEIIAATFLAILPIAAVLILAFGFFPFLLFPLAIPVVVAVVVLYGIFLLTRWFRVTTSVYTITDQRVYKAHGRLRFFLSQTTYDKLTDLHVQQSFFGRVWGFGTVRLDTAGTGIALEGLRDPFGSKVRIEDARAAFLRLLVGEAEASRPAKPVEEQEREAGPVDVEKDVLWTGGPSPASFLPNLVMLAVMVAIAGASLLAAPLLGWRALLFPALLAVLASTSGLGVWIRLRHTRYHVARRGVFITSGWLTRRRVETTYAKVTDVTVYQGVLGRMLDFGSITINTAGSNMAPVVFAGVAGPEAVKDLIDATRREEARR